MKFFFRLLAAAERNPPRKRRPVHFLTGLLSKGNDAVVVALCLSDSFPLLQPAPFQLVCQLRQAGTGWGSQRGSFSLSHETWGLLKELRLRSVPALREKTPVGVQQLPRPVRLLAGRAVHDYLWRGTPDIYTRKHLFHLWVMRRKGRIGWTWHGDTRLLNCW